MQSKRSQTQKATCMILFKYSIQNKETHRDTSVVARSWGEGIKGSDCLMGTRFPLGDEKFWSQMVVSEQH